MRLKINKQTLSVLADIPEVCILTYQIKRLIAGLATAQAAASQAPVAAAGESDSVKHIVCIRKTEDQRDPQTWLAEGVTYKATHPTIPRWRTIHGLRA